jgi:hypothetical protein
MQMKRKVFDVLASAGGAVVVVVLVIAGALLMWGYTFSSNNVHNELAQQQVYFPTRAEILSAPPSSTEIPPKIKHFLLPYAGQEVLNGPQAETYADHFIAVHLSEMPYHGIYAEVSAAAMAAPKGSPQAAKLSALEETIFRGTTLRSMLLEAYGFWTLGEIAMWAAIAAFSLAVVMAVLVALGIWHSRRTPADVELLESALRRQ